METQYIINGTTSSKQKSDKTLWGQLLWFSLHNGALNYPVLPTDRDMKDMVGFIRALPLMIPCDECKNHADRFINQLTEDQLLNASRTPESLFHFFWLFHNDVNQRLNKPTITLKKAYDIYMNDPISAVRNCMLFR
uniref:thiol oxidase n=1 Tax=viral metagenome TaxID=1070528 RepID=A0A6C0LV32_9ZZZZ